MGSGSASRFTPTLSQNANATGGETQRVMEGKARPRECHFVRCSSNIASAAIAITASYAVFHSSWLRSLPLEWSVMLALLASHLLRHDDRSRGRRHSAPGRQIILESSGAHPISAHFLLPAGSGRGRLVRGDHEASRLANVDASRARQVPGVSFLPPVLTAA